MSLMHLNFSSRCLSGETTVSVILPVLPGAQAPAEFYRSGRKYKVLWLLHGAFGDHTDWVRRTQIELYANARDLIVVMPSGLNAGYANWPSFGPGYMMFDYLTEELMPLVYGWLPASDRREDNYIAGLSMGGSGTCIYALNHPEKFAAAAVFSAAPRELAWTREHDERLYRRKTVTAQINHGGIEAYEASYENTWRLVDEHAHDPNLPRLYFTCGTEDGGYPAFQRFQAHAEAVGLKATFESVPGYRHEWPFWDLAVRKALDFFGLPALR